VLVGKRLGGLVAVSFGHQIASGTVKPIKPVDIPRDELFGTRETLAQRSIHDYVLSPPALISSLVGRDIASGRSGVGGPITLIEIRPTGARWLNQGSCPDIDQDLWLLDHSLPLGLAP
jgi:hypothetical protein